MSLHAITGRPLGFCGETTGGDVLDSCVNTAEAQRHEPRRDPIVPGHFGAKLL